MLSTSVKVLGACVPAGSYVAKFVDVEPINNDYGPGLEWRWEIVSGPHAGQMVKRTTSNQPTTKNICGQIIAGLKGKPLSANEDINLSEFVAKTICEQALVANNSST